MSRRLLEDTISPTVDEENRDIGRLSFLSNVEEENSRNSMNIDANVKYNISFFKLIKRNQL